MLHSELRQISMYNFPQSTHYERPVDTQVQRYDDDVVKKEVNSFCPAVDGTMATSVKLGEEECAEAVHFNTTCLLLTAGHHKV